MLDSSLGRGRPKGWKRRVQGNGVVVEEEIPRQAERRGDPPQPADEPDARKASGKRWNPGNASTIQASWL